MRRFGTPLALLLGFALVAAVVQADDKAAAREKVDGFVQLFNGKNLDGWIGSTKGYSVEDGVLACLPKGGGNLLSAKQYSDFVLRFEFKLPSGGNNGLAIRTPASGNPAFAGSNFFGNADLHRSSPSRARTCRASVAVYVQPPERCVRPP